MSWLRLTGFPRPYQTYTKCVSTLISLICCPLAYSSSLLTQIPILVGSDFGVLGYLWSQNDVKNSWSGVFAPPANALGLSIEEKDLLFCTGIGRWPLPLPSYLCNPANALGLSIEEKDLFFCTGIGRWPLPLPSYLCNPANALGLSIEEKDLVFCRGIGRWPLPLPSYLCNPANALLASQLKRRTSSSAHA
jgi:hypothetical protein